MDLVQEGLEILRSSFFLAEGTARAMAEGVAVRRQAWLQKSFLKPDLQTKIADLLFEGKSLFSERTNDLLTNMM